MKQPVPDSISSPKKNPGNLARPTGRSGSGSGSGSGSNTSTTKLDNRDMIKAANKFALQLVQNQTLLGKWFDALTNALKEKQYEVAIMDNFISQKAQNGVDDFNTTYAYVIQAQQRIAAYSVYYWSALYKTSKVKQSSPNDDPVDGSPLSIVGSGSSAEATNVSFGTTLLIEYKFNQLVLTWDTTGGLNKTSGRLIFGLKNVAGKPVKGFSGTITEADGTAYTYAGLAVDPKSADGQATAKKTSPEASSGLQKLEYANQIINMVSQALFMALNMVMLAKAAKEIASLKTKIQEGKDNGEDTSEDEKSLESVEGDQGVNEVTANQQVEAASEISDPVRSMSEDQFNDGSEDVWPASEPIDIPGRFSEPFDVGSPPSYEESLLMQREISNQVESEGTEPNTSSEDEEGEENDGETTVEDGSDALEVDGDDLMFPFEL